MAKDYGVYKEATDLWVKTSTPLVLGTAAEAQHYNETDAMTVANYLTLTEGVTFRVGRPDDRHG